MRKLLNDEAGFIVSAELILVATIVIMGMVVGLASLRDSVTSELIDVGNALGALSQNYSYSGISKATTTSGTFHGKVNGSAFVDGKDDCDCVLISIDIGANILTKNESTTPGVE